MPMNVGEAITPAMTHTSRLLFKPFVLRKWLALGFVSMFAGMGSGGGNYRAPSGGTSSTSSNGEMGDMTRMGEQILSWIAGHILLIVLGALALFLLSFILAWVGSVLKFVYLNQITRTPLAIREPFNRFKGLGTSFFLWEIGFGLVVMFAIGLLIVLPIVGIFATDSTVLRVSLVIWSVVVAMVVLLAVSATSIFSRDFVLSTMFVRGVKVLEAWDIVIPILKANVGQSLLYILMLIAIGIVSGIGAAIAVLAMGVIFLIPGGLLALIGYGIYSAGHAVSPALIAYSVAVGIPLLFAFSYGLSCAIQPFEVFRRAFALVCLGQADPSLATVPIPPRSGPRSMPEHGI